MLRRRSPSTPTSRSTGAWQQQLSLLLLPLLLMIFADGRRPGRRRHDEQRCSRHGARRPRGTHRLFDPRLAFLVLADPGRHSASLNPTTFSALPDGEFSLRWYRTLAESPQWTHAFRNSLKIAIATTPIATPLGTLAAIGARATCVLAAENRDRRGLITAPRVVPVVVVAIAFYFLFAPLGLVNGSARLIVAHSALAAPFVVIVVHARCTGSIPNRCAPPQASARRRTPY